MIQDESAMTPAEAAESIKQYIDALRELSNVIKATKQGNEIPPKFSLTYQSGQLEMPSPIAVNEIYKNYCTYGLDNHTEFHAFCCGVIFAEKYHGIRK